MRITVQLRSSVRHADLEVAACDSTLVAKVLQAKLFPV